VLVQHLCQAGCGKLADLLGFRAQIHNSLSQREVKLDRFSLQFAYLEFHAYERSIFCEAADEDVKIFKNRAKNRLYDYRSVKVIFVSYSLFVTYWREWVEKGGRGVGLPDSTVFCPC
jgi:hypothetical protein